MALDRQVAEFYREKIEKKAFFVPGVGLEALRAGADAAFNDKEFVTDIAFSEDRLVSFGTVVTGAPRYLVKPEFAAFAGFVQAVTEAEVPSLRVRIFRPTLTDEVLPVVLYFHGGGFVLHNIASHDALTRQISKEWNAVVISAEYRLCPENKYPAYLQDAWALLCWVSENAGGLNIDPSRIILSGDSAGATICAAVSKLAAMVESCDCPMIYAQVLFYGEYGAVMPEQSESMKEFGGGDYVLPREMVDYFKELTVPKDLSGEDPFFYPGRRLSGKSACLQGRCGTDESTCDLDLRALSGMPRTIVVSAECDPLRDDGEAFAAALRAAGADVTDIRAPGAMHGFLLYWHKFDFARKIIKEIGQLLKAADC